MTISDEEIAALCGRLDDRTAAYDAGHGCPDKDAWMATEAIRLLIAQRDDAREAARSVNRVLNSVRNDAKEALAAAVLAEREACAKVAQDWLEDWARDLAATRDEYIDASASGFHAGRKISEGIAKAFAHDFNERSDAVYDCSKTLPAAIRSRHTPTKAGGADE